MDAPSPRVGSCGIIGNIVQIWWCTAHNQRFAVTVEIDMMENVWWVLWIHLNDRWERQLFFVQGEDHNGEWDPLYGMIQGVAVVYDGWDLYLILEHLEVTRQMIWLVYVVGEREPNSGKDALLLLELWVPEAAGWEVHNI
jgi:hypothetical protein